MKGIMVSVIIPAYNAGNYIFEAVGSAFSQDVPKEIIIIDDGSTWDWVTPLVHRLRNKYDIAEAKYGKESADGSMILKWSGRVTADNLKNSQFSVYILRNTVNKNVAVTRNRGVKLARGRYVAFLDADDVWLKGKLEKQLALMEYDGKAPLCTTARRIMDSDGKTLNKIIGVPEKITRKDLEKTNYINLSSVLARKSVMKKYPMRHSDAHEDYLTWLMLLKDYEYALGINEPLLLYRKAEKSKSANKLKSAVMTYKTYRYAGFGLGKSFCSFCMYVANGVKKVGR